MRAPATANDMAAAFTLVSLFQGDFSRLSSSRKAPGSIRWELLGETGAGGAWRGTTTTVGNNHAALAVAAAEREVQPEVPGRL